MRNNREPGPWLFRISPLAIAEFRRLSRSFADYEFRCGLPLLLLAALGAVVFARYPDELARPFRLEFVGGVGVSQAAWLAEWFSFSLLFAELMLVFVVVPVYFAGSILDEVAKRSWEALLLTEMREPDIVYGKMQSRAMHSFRILLAALPVLAAMQAWGGVDLPGILRCHLVLAASIAGFGGIAMLRALETGDLFAVMRFFYWRPFGWTLLLVAAFTLRIAYDGMIGDSHWLGLAWTVAFSLAFLAVAEWACRRACDKDRWYFDEDPERWHRERLRQYIERLQFERRLGKTEEAEDEAGETSMAEWEASGYPPPPLAWPERSWPLAMDTGRWRGSEAIRRSLGGLANDPRYIYLFCFLLAVTGFVGMAWIAPAAERFGPELRFAGRLLAGVLAFAWTLNAGLAAAMSIARERDRRSLETLLAIPMDRKEILRRIARRCWNGRPFTGYALAAILAAAVLASGISVFSALIAISFVLLGRWFLIWLGMAISCVAVGGTRAVTWFLIVVLFLTWVHRPIGEWTRREGHAWNPRERWEACLFSGREGMEAALDPRLPVAVLVIGLMCRFIATRRIKSEAILFGEVSSRKSWNERDAA